MPDDLIVHDKDWPYGLRCGECSRLLEDGDRYAERLMSMVHEVPVVKIVCVPCDVDGNPQHQSALQDAESELWEGPGVDVKAMIEAADKRRRAAGRLQ